MSTVLLVCLFFSLCLFQWFLSRSSLGTLRYLPTGFYLLIAGTAAVRTIASGTFSFPAGALLMLALVFLLLLDFLARRVRLPADAGSVRSAG